MSKNPDFKTEAPTTTADGLGMSDTVTLTLEKQCKICKQTPCICNEIQCPIHGRIKAAPNGKTTRMFAQKDLTKPGKLKDAEVEIDNFKCSAKDCTIERAKNELDYPHREPDKSE